MPKVSYALGDGVIGGCEQSLDICWEPNLGLSARAVQIFT